MLVAWPGVLVALVAAAGLVVGCAKKGAPSTSAPASEMGYAGAAPSEEAPAAEEGAEAGGDQSEASLPQLEDALLGYEDALLAAGVSLPDDVVAARTQMSRDSTPASAASVTEGRCTKICELSETICELHDRICALADEHVAEARYQRACSRAELDCERATDACDGCED